MQRTYRASAVIASIASLSISATPSPSRDNEWKAATLCNVISFTNWPASAFSSNDAPLVVGVWGEGPIALLLDQFLANETWHGRPVVVRHLTSAAGAPSCHVLFVAQSEHLLWRSVSAHFAQRPMLTVSDAGDFTHAGGMVQLTTFDGKQRLVVNLGAARTAGLTFSSKLLRLAEVTD